MNDTKPQWRYTTLDISGSLPEYRKDFAQNIDYIDEYVWYVNLDGTVSDVGDHYIAIRTDDVDYFHQILDILEEEHGFHPSYCLVEHGRIEKWIPLFQQKYGEPYGTSSQES